MSVVPNSQPTGGHGSALDRVLRALEEAGCRPHKEGPQYAAHCCMPGHPDPTPSLKIRWVPQLGRGDGGGVVMHCHGCGDAATGQDLAEALGLELAALFDEPLPKRDESWPRVGRTAEQRKAGKRRGKLGRLPKALVPRPQPTPRSAPGRHRWKKARIYPYVDAAGELQQENVRKECDCSLEDGTHKTFSQRYLVEGKRVNRAPDTFDPVLFRLPQVIEQVGRGGIVWLPEGEKDVETAEDALGLVATTNVNGGNAFTDAYAETLRGATVHAVIDRDKAGWRRGVKIADVLDGVAAQVRLFLPATTEEKSDLTDHVEAGFGVDDFVQVHVDEVRVWACAAEMPNHVAAVKHAAVNADAYQQRAQNVDGDDKDKDLAAARRWAKETEIQFESMRAQVQDAHSLAVTLATEWATEGLEVANASVERAAQLVTQAHEALGLAVPAAVHSVLADDPVVAPVDPDHDGDRDHGDEQGGTEVGRTPARLIEPDDNDTNYRILNGRIVQYKRKTARDGGVDYSDEPVLSLAVQVTQREVAEQDDDAEEDADGLPGRSGRGGDDLNPPEVPTPVAWTIQYVDPNSGELMRMRIDNDTFEKMTWLDGLPGPPDFNRSTTGRKTVQSAIFAVSPPVKDVVRYRSTGWRKSTDGDWIFVHAGGAIGKDGYRTAPVLLGGALARYDLPDPVQDPGVLREAFFRASGSMMSAFPRRVAAPLLGHMWRSAVARIKGACVLTGSPGSYKTALASLAMHHFGEMWTNDRPATSGGGEGDTSKAMRLKLHLANHVTFWDDDFAPTDSVEAGMRRLGAFIKMVGNSEARELNTRDGQGLLGGRRPRASGIATSELPPRAGGEARRCLRIPMLADEINFENILLYDEPERRHQRALVMASFLRWVAEDVEQRREDASEEASRYRDALIGQGNDKELSATIAAERSGWVLMLRFLTELGAITADEQVALLEDSNQGLVEAAAASSDPDLATTTAAKVHEMLAHALRTGTAYVEDVRTGDAPPWPLAAELGWQRFPLGYDIEEQEQRYRVEKRNGAIHLGYVMHDPTGRDSEAAIFADKDALDQTVTAVAKTLGDAPALDVGTVLRALRDGGLLVTEREEGRVRLTVKRRVPCLGRRRRFAVLDLERFLAEEPDSDDGGADPGSGGGKPSDPWKPADLFAPDTEPGAEHTDSADGDGVVGGRDETDDERINTGLTTPATGDVMHDEDRAPTEFTNASGHTAARRSVPGGQTLPCILCGEHSSAMFDAQPMHVLCFMNSTHTATPQAGERKDPPRTEPENRAAVRTPVASRPVEKPLSPATAGLEASAVVADVDGVWFPDGRRVDLPEPLTHAGQLAQLGYDLNLGTKVTSWRAERAQIWVTQALLSNLGVEIDPQALPRDVGARARHQPVRELTAGTAFVDDAVAAGWSIGGQGAGLGQWTRMWREDSDARGVFLVLIPALATDDEQAILPVLAGDPGPVELARRIQLTATNLGMPYAVSAGATGFDLLKILAAKRRKQLRERSENPVDLLILHDVPEPAKQPNQESDFNWCRSPGKAEAGLGYVHLYDRGGSYAAAAAGLEVGIGEAEHVGDEAVFDPKVPGYWQFMLPEPGDWRYPHPLWPSMKMPAPDRPVWATTPTLQYAAELGYEVEVLQAWVWPEHGRVLDNWQKRLSQARAELDVGDHDHQLARNMVKDVYTRTIGLMGSSEYMAGKEGFRPDWRHHIIAKARANMLRRVMQVGASDVWPLAMRTDAIVYASDESDALNAWPGKAEQLGRGLGQYKPEGTLPMAEYLELLENRRSKDRYDLDGKFQPPAKTLGPAAGDLS